MSTATVIAIIAMVFVLIGMLIVKKTMAASPMLQPILFLCLALELGLVVFVFYNQLSGGGKSSALEKAERREYAKGVKAGEFLKSKASGQKVLVISTANSKTSKIYQAFIKGIKEKFGDVTEDETKAKDSEGGDDGGVTADDVKEVLDKHADAQVIVFYGAFPGNYEKLDTKASFFLIDAGAADTAKVKKDIDGGKILGIIIAKSKTGIKPSDPVEKDPAEAFDKRYILVEKSNLPANKDNF